MKRILCLAAALAAFWTAPIFAQDHFPIQHGGHTVTVWYHVPAGSVATTPIVIVMHGVKRDADRYLADWTGLSDAHHFIVVCPEFSLKEFPGEEGYIYGNTVDKAGHPVPKEQWAFSMIEPVFDAIKAKVGSTDAKYSLFGHSAGSQFVQRFVYFVPDARLERAVAANAGWYVLPNYEQGFPYGLKGTVVTPDELKHALGAPLTILLGTADTDPKDPVLRHTPGADAQGMFRFARGNFFFKTAQRAAADLNVPLAWHLDTAPGIAHSDSGMAPFAIKHLVSN